jgi:hypothetical protein
MPTAAVVGGMRFLSFSQLAVAACRCRRCILFLRTVSMQVATPTPQTAGRLLAVGPDVAKFLAVVALRKGVLRFVGLYLDGNVAESGHLNRSWDFFVFGRVTRNKGRVICVVPSEDLRAVDILNWSQSPKATHRHVTTDTTSTSRFLNTETWQ